MRSCDEGPTAMIPETMIMPDSRATTPLHVAQPTSRQTVGDVRSSAREAEGR